MKKRNKIATIVLFLAALVVGFDAEPSWSAFTNPLPPGYSQCDISIGFGGPLGGMVVLPDGTILVADRDHGLYSFKPGSTCPSPKTKLSSHRYLGMAIGLDGRVYANDYDPNPLTATGNVYIVSPVTGEPIGLPVLTGVYGLGMALDPLTGDLYVTRCDLTTCPGSDIRHITGLYGAVGGPQINPFVTVQNERFDGLAWSCDGTRLVAASQGDKVFQFARDKTTILGFPISVPRTPDGVAFGKEGTIFAGYFFADNENGEVFKIKNDGSTIQEIASGGTGGDFVAVDTTGNLLLTQNTLVTRLSTTASGTPGTSGGQWVLPGSSLCGDLGCGAKAATTPQIDYDGQRCLSGLNADLLVTLAQSACVGCASCATLNQARSTLLDLLNSLDPPRHCLDLLKSTLQSLYRSCPCNPDPLACVPPCASPYDPNCYQQSGRLSGGTCLAQTKFPLGIDLESYDPILQAFIREVMSP